MRQTELQLTDEERQLIESYRAKGLHHAREVNRAHILAALDREIPESQIIGCRANAYLANAGGVSTGRIGICPARRGATGKAAPV